jgi:hypothetical protein
MSIGHQIYWLIILSIATACIAWTITQEEVFREWRDICKEKSETCRRVVERKFFYVWTCEYCFSHWVALILLIITGVKLLFDDWRGYLIAFFTIPWVANQLMSLYRMLRVDIKHENLLAEKVKKENGRSTKSEPPA